MASLHEVVDRVAEQTGFSGVVRVDRGPELLLECARGLADRRHGQRMRVDSQLAMASGSKTFTALVVMRLVEQGRLRLDTKARSLLGADLPLVDRGVTVEQLLSHRSGIGDYLDEDEPVPDYPMPVSVHRLAETIDYLAVLDGHATKFAPEQRFSYCNGGYVVLALLAERAAGRSFHDLVEELVCRPAGMTGTAYLRSDCLPGRAAVGYVETPTGWRTNVFHLPVRGSGDGGCFTTVADMRRFWMALTAGRIVSPATWADMTRSRTPRSEGPQYGLGCRLHDTAPTVYLIGCDTGVSMRSWHDPPTAVTATIMSTTTHGA
ncbi:MAG TPA: serine hydrolase domain-containing protein [Dermatophilaceae bacterium]|nr:serine hydrolase domain-containing protein [Dermatophilaceae bacterium]